MPHHLPLTHWYDSPEEGDVGCGQLAKSWAKDVTVGVMMAHSERGRDGDLLRLAKYPLDCRLLRQCCQMV